LAGCSLAALLRSPLQPLQDPHATPLELKAAQVARRLGLRPVQRSLELSALALQGCHHVRKSLHLLRVRLRRSTPLSLRDLPRGSQLDSQGLHVPAQLVLLRLPACSLVAALPRQRLLQHHSLGLVARRVCLSLGLFRLDAANLLLQGAQRTQNCSRIGGD
jgi:hypothetical protein